MLTTIHPKLPMRNKAVTRNFYIQKLGFTELGITDYDAYLMLGKDNIEIHFFEFADINPADNCGQVYIRTNDIEQLYQWLQQNNCPIHPNGALDIKPWGQKEFSVLDPDNNLITFGQAL